MSKPDCSSTINEIMLFCLFYLLVRHRAQISIKKNLKLLREIEESLSLETFKIICQDAWEQVRVIRSCLGPRRWNRGTLWPCKLSSSFSWNHSVKAAWKSSKPRTTKRDTSGLCSVVEAKKAKRVLKSLHLAKCQKGKEFTIEVSEC